MRPETGHGSQDTSDLSASQRLAQQLRLASGHTRLSATRAQRLEEQSWSVVPTLFQDLVGYERPALMEWTHQSDSLFARALSEATGKEHPSRYHQNWDSASLGSDEGVRRAREQLELEQPLHVWLSPACEAYSPSQHVHQDASQKQEQLTQKRRECLRQLIGMSCIVHMCIQQGIHVSVEMPARSNAWRLQVMQGLKKKYGLKMVTVQGCMVNLRNRKGEFARQGWCVMTTHDRLARTLDLPCKCPKSVKHDRMEGHANKYTKEFIHRVCRVLLQEHMHHDVLEECRGNTRLLEGFGEGEFCACADVTTPFQSRKCAMCLPSRYKCLHEDQPGQEGSDQDVTEEELCMYSDLEISQVEDEARRLKAIGDYSHTACEALVARLPSQRRRQHRSAMLDHKTDTLLLGVYAHGNHYGVTKWSRRLPQSSSYLWSYLKKWSPEAVHGSTLVINKNCKHGMHKDVNNLPGTQNYVIGVSSYKQGEVWLEGPGPSPEYPKVNRQTPNGQILSGHLRSVQRQVVTFDAHKWHATQDWSGTRWVVAAYTSRGVKHLEQGDVKWLRKQDFPLPPARSPRPLEGQEGEEQAMVGDTGRGKTSQAQEEEAIKRKLYLLHAATGHGSTRHMIEALKRRKASPLVIRLAEEFRCSICQEKARVQPRQTASLEPIPPKFHTISADIGHWVHPTTGEHQNFMVVVDEGSRFRMAKILLKGQKQAPTSAACINYLQEGWFQVFGKPKTLRLDPAGSFRSSTVESFCDRHSIYHDVIPGEAHWQIGLAEQAVQGLKLLMTKVCDQDPSTTPEEALSLSVSVFNQREVVRGYSPVQHVLGQAPDAMGRFLPHEGNLPEEVILNQPQGTFEQETKRRAEAEKALAEWVAQQRLTKALNSRSRPHHRYQPGDLVYFWRTQESGRHKKQPGTNQGRFLGPARILAMETRRDSSGHSRPAHAIWCVRGRSLLKCSPEQLRPASDREELLEALGPEQTAPWTFSRVAEEVGGNSYQDLTQEIPSEQEWLRAQDPQEEQQPARYRISRKRPSPQVGEPSERDPEDLEGPDDAEPSQPSVVRRTASYVGPKLREPECEPWWDRVAESAWAAEACSYWTEEQQAVEIEIPLPESRRGQEHMCKNMQGFFVSALKRRAIEVCERKLSMEDREKFREAKSVEVRNFISAKAFEALPKHLQPDRSQAVGMRWILTWKVKDDGGVKAKARAVLLGYQDPQYEFRSTAAPVMTRQTRQLFLQLSANNHWAIQKGDITGAFLQGREYPDDLFCIPCPEICSSMGIPEGSITKLKRACYGLVDAPLEWYKTIAEYLESIGLTRLWSDSCAWVWRPDGPGTAVRGMVTGHVDDFLFGGSSSDLEWAEILTKIKTRFKWGDWDADSFVQCGVQVKTVPEGFELSQPKYLETVDEIPLNARRRKDTKAATTPQEKSQLRALLGALSWYAQQTAPHLSADVSLMLSEVGQSTVNTIVKANQLLSVERNKKGHRLLIQRCDTSDMQLVAWVDAASQNRLDGSSTQGIFIGAASRKLIQGEIAPVSPISWHSTRIERKCRSPGAAETQAAVNGEDALFYARFQWSEMVYGLPNLREPSETVRHTGGYLVTDSRNVFDKLRTEMLVIKGAEKRANIELLSLKEAQQTSNLVIRWVHSEAQLANSLTKCGGNHEMDLYYRMNFAWRIVEDEEMMSARRRKTKGLQPLQRTTQQEVINDVLEKEHL